MDITSLKNLIQQTKKPLITTHKSPDGDAIGSSVAWFKYLQKIGQSPLLILPDSPPAFLLPFLQGVEFLVYETNETAILNLIHEYDALYCLDFNHPSRVGKEMEMIFNQIEAPKVMLDHHQDPSDFCDFTISEPTFCSTAQLVFEVIENLGDLDIMDVEIGRGIYLGIVTDTGSFRFPSVDANTHRIAGYLINLGLKHFEIHEAVYDVNTVGRLQLRGYAIAEKMVFHPTLPIGWISLTREELERFNYEKGDTEGLVNVLLSIEGIQVGIFLSEQKDGVKMSFRSKGAYFVNQFASKHFNGGGHQYAAGGKSEDSLDVTLARLVSLLEELKPYA
jgi:bifunctional oligoribonuclease and PAP phosphatase NrnA